MTNSPKLSVTIPTYNRRHYLQQTLDVLLPQISDDVEVIVFDNCSTDDTHEYLEKHRDKVKYFRQESNIGPDRNMLSCLTEASGEYVWLLCDDDLPCSNAISNILGAAHSHSKAPVLYLTAHGLDKDMNGYDATPVETLWNSYDSNEFLSEIGFMFTFASSIVVRRDCLDLNFIKKHIGSWLVPAATLLSTVGGYGGGCVSKRPLLYGRSDNSGGYGAYTVFTKNLSEILRSCSPNWFEPRVLRKIYNENLRSVLPVVIRNWPFDVIGALRTLRFGYGYSAFYTAVLPAMIKRPLRRLKRRNPAT